MLDEQCYIQTGQNPFADEHGNVITRRIVLDIDTVLDISILFSSSLGVSISLSFSGSLGFRDEFQDWIENGHRTDLLFTV